MKELLLAAASGALLAAAMPGPSAWPLAFLALAPWAIATARARSRRLAFAVDYLAGLCFFVPTMLWLVRITAAAFLPVALLAPLFFALAGFLYRRLRRVMPSAIALPLAWTTSELARAYSPPGGYPWDLLGHAAAGWLDLAGIASLGGALLVSAVIALANGAIVDAVARATAAEQRRTAWWPVAAGTLVVAIAAVGGGWLRRDLGPLREGPSFAGLQPNVPQKLKDSGADWDTIMLRELHLAMEAARQRPDVVVLPETMLPAGVVADGVDGLFRIPRVKGTGSADAYREKERVDLAEFRHAIGKRPWFLAGVILLDHWAGGPADAVRMRNSAILYDEKDRKVARYDKRHLVPGSEGLPFIDEGTFAEWVRDQIGSLSDGGMIPDLVAGKSAPLFELPLPDRPAVRFGVAICFDNAFADLFADYARAGADFVVVLSNEAWFPESYEMDAMLAFSAFRAIETRRSVLRVTNSGISCLIAPDGSLASVLESGGRRAEIEGVFVARPPICGASTVYLKVGDVPFVVLASFSIVAALVAARRISRLP